MNCRTLNRYVLSLFFQQILILLFLFLSYSLTNAQGPPDIVWMRGGHMVSVGGACISADGTILVTAQVGGIAVSINEAKVFRLQDGMLLKTISTYNGHDSYRTMLSPTENKLATFGQDLDSNYVKMWSIPSGVLLWKQPIGVAYTANGLPEDFNVLSFTSNGAYVYVRSSDSAGKQVVSGFKVSDGTPLGSRSSIYGFAAGVNQIASFGQEQNNDLTTLYDSLLNPLAFWSFATPINTFSPDASLLASYARMSATANIPYTHQSIILQNGQDGTNVEELFNVGIAGSNQTPNVIGLIWQNPNTIYGMSIEYYPELGNPGSYGNVRSWDSITGAMQTLWTLPYGTPQSFGVWPFGTPSASLLAVGGIRRDVIYSAQRGFINVVNIADGSPLSYTDSKGTQRTAFNFHESNVTSVAWSSNGLRIASGSADGTVKVWQALDGAQLCSIQIGGIPEQGEPVSHVALSPDGSQLAVCTDSVGVQGPGSSGMLYVWNIQNADAPVLSYTIPLSVWQAVYSADGSMFASVEGTSGNFLLCLRHSSDGSLIRSVSIPSGTPEYSGGVTFSPDGKSLAVFVSEIGYVAIHRVSDLAVLANQNYDKPSSVSFTENGASLAIGFRHGSYGLALLKTSDLSVKWQHGGGADSSGFGGHVYAVACDPCTDNVAAESFFTANGVTKNNLIFWKASNGGMDKRYDQEVISGGYFGEGAVHSITYSPDGQYYAYARWDNALVVARNPYFMPPALSTLNASPNPDYGGSHVTGAAALNCEAPIGDAIVSLSSSEPSLASVPASVDIPVGKKSATFAVSTQPVSVNETVILTAKYAFPGRPMVTKTKTITLKPPVLSTVTLNKSTIKGGTTVTLTVTLTGDTAVDTPVGLSSNSSAATVPANIIVPSGSKTMTYLIQTMSVVIKTSVVITAVEGGITKTVKLSLTP